tara:strand:+ start:225 stop:695 length:471 start_codon:yes stop_codon:yes gene_type:complete
MYEYRCKIVRVVDGDTIDVDIDLGFGIWLHKERVRLYEVDTPESRTRDKVEKIFGLEAKKMIESWLPVDSTQKLITKKDKAGKFGRILGEFEIFDPKQDKQTTVNEWMIINNYAVRYNGQSKKDILNEHIQNYQRLVEYSNIIDKDILTDYVKSHS